jgi:CheY-like chemotaxis protein
MENRNKHMNMPQSEHKARALKVLVAEDNIINQRLAIGMLKQLGHTGVIVGDGEKALKCLTQLKFDLVLMDVMMPNMDGLEALAALRTLEQVSGAHMPVIMATAHTEPGDKSKFRQAGADGYVAKPVELETLQAEIKRVTGV